jgi:tRNA-2-methylthio-N6-dimethylallyladenosine synthase
VTTTVTRAAPHYLLADAAPLTVRRTRAGEAWETAAVAPPPSASSAALPVLLGLPARRPSAS